MADSMHKAVWEWLQSCPHISDLYFNFARHSAAEVSILTAGGDVLVRQYISGAAERRYDFAIVRFELLGDAPNSPENLEALVDAEQLRSWVDVQEASGNYPLLPKGCIPLACAAYDSGAGSFAAHDADRAKYIFQFYIDYLKEA